MDNTIPLQASSPVFTPPSATLLAELLVQAQLLPRSGRDRCLQHWNPSSTETVPANLLANRLKTTLQDLGLAGIHVILLPVQRANLASLPALLHDGNAWTLLTSQSGERVMDLKDASEDSHILWIGRPVIAGAGGQTSSVSLRKSRSAALILSELLRDKRWLSRVFIYTLTLNIFAVLTSIFAMQVYDRVVPTLSFSTLTTLVTGVLLMLALELVFRIRRSRMLDKLACSVDQRVCEHVYNHLLSVRLDRLPPSLGTLAAQLNSLESIRQFIATAIVFGVVDVPFTLFFLGVIWVLGGIVAVPYLAMVPFALLIGLISHNQLDGHITNHITRRNEREGLLVDSIRGFETIKTANLQSHFAANWQALISNINVGYQQQRHITNSASFVTSTLSTLAYVFAIVVGVQQMATGEFTIGGMIACSILGSRVLGPIAQAAQFLTQWQTVKQSLKIVDSILELDQDRESRTLLSPSALAAEIDLQDVEFAYTGSPVNIVDIASLNIRPGERIILSGPTGSGKSTLFKLLAGLYQPTRGNVRIAKIDLRELEPDTLYSLIGYLPQTVHLFKGTLLSNLTLGNQNRDDAHLVSVRSALGIDSIALTNPKGIELPIAEGGAGLSRGQEQLAAVARLIVSKPRIWLLDEPTSSLDQDNEKRVWKAIQNYLQPEDILVVSTHKPSMLASMATRMIVMKSGRIVLDDKPEAVFEKLTRPKLKA